MAWFRRRKSTSERESYPYSIEQWMAQMGSFGYQGLRYPLTTLGGSATPNAEGPSGFEGTVASAYRSNGIVFACMVARMMIFSDVRFGFRDIATREFVTPSDGRNPGASGLSMLRTPWFGGTTGDLLARMEADVSLAGNAFVLRTDELVRLRPDWVTIVAETPKDASVWHPDAKLLGYLYKPGGPGSSEPAIAYVREDVAHYAPYPDPTSRFRGVSWVSTVWPEIKADQKATAHKEAFFANGATVNLILEYPPELKLELFRDAVKSFQQEHEGLANAGKTLHLLGATAKPVGSTMQEIDFKALQGGAETRIAAASGIGPVITFLSEGLQGSALNAGNYGAARRNVADRTIRPLWRNVSGSLGVIIPAPQGKELWFDDKDVAFIREDQADAAKIRQTDAATIKSLVDSGFTPESARDAVISGDFGKLQHTGLVSVQLNKPGVQPNGNQPQAEMEPETVP